MASPCFSDGGAPQDLGGRAAQAAAAEDAARAGGAGSVSQWALGDYPPPGPAVAAGRHGGVDGLVDGLMGRLNLK